MGAISQQLGVAMQSMDTMAVRPRPSPAAHASAPVAHGSRACWGSADRAEHGPVRCAAARSARPRARAGRLNSRAAGLCRAERQLGELDVQSTMIDATMATGSTATPVDEVESLMSEVAEEHGMNLAEQCVQPGPRPAATTHPCSHRALFADSRRWRRREQRRRQSLKRSLPRLRRMSCSGGWKHSNEVEVQELPAVLNTMHSARLSGQLQPANTPSLLTSSAPRSQLPAPPPRSVPSRAAASARLAR